MLHTKHTQKLSFILYVIHTDAPIFLGNFFLSHVTEHCYLPYSHSVCPIQFPGYVPIVFSEHDKHIRSTPQLPSSPPINFISAARTPGVSGQCHIYLIRFYTIHIFEIIIARLNCCVSIINNNNNNNKNLFNESRGLCMNFSWRVYVYVYHFVHHLTIIYLKPRQIHVTPFMLVTRTYPPRIIIIFMDITWRIYWQMHICLHARSRNKLYAQRVVIYLLCCNRNYCEYNDRNFQFDLFSWWQKFIKQTFFLFNVFLGEIPEMTHYYLFRMWLLNRLSTRCWKEVPSLLDH